MLSRFPYTTEVKSNEQTSQLEESINYTIAHALPVALSVSEILEASQNDPELRAVSEALKNNTWHKYNNIGPYYRIRNELAVKRNILLRQERIVIPTSLRQRVLDIVHETHGLGIVKTKQHLRSKVWWPGMDAEIERQIKACTLCSATQPQGQHPSFKMTKCS